MQREKIMWKKSEDNNEELLRDFQNVTPQLEFHKEKKEKISKEIFDVTMAKALPNEWQTPNYRSRKLREHHQE